MKPFLLEVGSEYFKIYGIRYECGLISLSVLSQYAGKTIRVSECRKEEANTAIVLGCTENKTFYRISELPIDAPSKFKNSEEIVKHRLDYMYSNNMNDRPEYDIMYKKLRKNMKPFKKYYIKFEVVK